MTGKAFTASDADPKRDAEIAVIKRKINDTAKRAESKDRRPAPEPEGGETEKDA